MALPLLFSGLTVCQAASFLQVDRSSKTFKYDGREVFLSGVNQAWVNYGADFGNNQSWATFCQLNNTLQRTKSYGGHAIRIWLHVEGDNTPLYDDNGFVIASDSKGSLIDDMRRYLQAAQAADVFVFFVLWNGALMRNQKTANLIWDDSKLQSYIDKVLTPMAKALSNEPALGGWEIMNEPEGIVTSGQYDSEPCFNTQPLSGSGAGWAGSIPMKNLLRFIGKQVVAIHQADPKTLVTIGSWSERPQTDSFGYRNYYTDNCLGKQAPGAYLDFFQIHSYAYQGRFSDHSPFNQKVWDYNLDRPLVLGEFNGQSSDGRNIQQLYDHAYNNKYNGAWGWQAIEDQLWVWPGMQEIRDKQEVKNAYFPDHPRLPPRCDCSDTAPDTQFSCQQQASWGKCSETWMKGYCCKSCFACQGCS